MTFSTSDRTAFPIDHNYSLLNFPNNNTLLSSTNNYTTLFPTHNYNTTLFSTNNTTSFEFSLIVASFYNYYNSKNLSRHLWTYLSPCIFLTGLLGNILILVVMTTSNLKGTSTCTYLKSMAVADLFTLVTGMIPEWLDYMDIVILKEVHPACCKLEKFLNFTSTDTSIWICVAFTIDRLIAVCFPMAECGLCLPRNVKYHVSMAFLAGVLKNLHVFWTRGAEFKSSSNSSLLLPFFANLTQNSSTIDTLTSAHSSLTLVSNCGSPTDHFRYFEAFVRPWLAFVLISLVPCLIIISCNVLIIRALIAMRSNKNKMPSDSEAVTVRQMTVLCLTASICFLVCNTPSILMLIMKPYWKHTRAYHLAKPFINQIFFINHSINFFLYCITGKRFREALKRVFSPSSRRYTMTSKLPVFSQPTGRFNRKKISSFNIPILFASLKKTPTTPKT